MEIGLFWKNFFIPVIGFGAVFGGCFEVVVASALAFWTAFSLPSPFVAVLGATVLGAAVLGAIELFVLVWMLIVPDILVLEDWLVARILSLVTVLALAALLSKVPFAFFDLAVFLGGAIMSSALV